jgi:hypothetical protein
MKLLACWSPNRYGNRVQVARGQRQPAADQRAGDRDVRVDTEKRRDDAADRRVRSHFHPCFGGQSGKLFSIARRPVSMKVGNPAKSGGKLPPNVVEILKDPETKRKFLTLKPEQQVAWAWRMRWLQAGAQAPDSPSRGLVVGVVAARRKGCGEDPYGG